MRQQSAAAQATANAAHASLSASGHILQRKCACGKNTAGGGACGKCAEKEKRLQRQAASEGKHTYDASATGAVSDVLSSQGRPLDTSTRSFMESRFGHDFSGVRVHTDTRAQESARDVNALAYTTGRDIVFNAGQYAPATSEGRKLIAHELAHVAQQSPSNGAGGSSSAMREAVPGLEGEMT